MYSSKALHFAGSWGSPLIQISGFSEPETSRIQLHKQRFPSLRLFSLWLIGGCCVKPVQGEWKEHLWHIACRSSLKLPILTIPKLLECSLLHLTSLLSWDCGKFLRNVLYSQTAVGFLCPWICGFKKDELEQEIFPPRLHRNKMLERLDCILTSPYFFLWTWCLHISRMQQA